MLKLFAICQFILDLFIGNIEDMNITWHHTASSAANVSDTYYPYFHLAPPSGWMNDPNGFSIFNNEYHLFYQYNPQSSQEPGIAHWGHAKSLDLFHWEHLPIAMYPDQEYDKSGVFSGSALVENGGMYLFYTGNANYPGEDPSQIERQALAYSDNGITFAKYLENPIIKAPNHQPNIRDPKVWKHKNTYYMVLGNSFENSTRGRVLLYSSQDMINWKETSVLGESDGDLGYMWECPDFFPLYNKWVLLFSPQGVKPYGDKYKNLYQCGYIIGDFDYETNLFTHQTDFVELDNGHDFYATQTTLDSSGRRLLVAWFDMWEQVYPERNQGWTGQMTIPRVLELTDDLRIIQKPVQEIMGVRGHVMSYGHAKKGTSVKLHNNVGEIRITSHKHRDFELSLISGSTRLTLSYDHRRDKITLDRGGNDGIRRTKWRPNGKLELHIFVDRSSIEVFCGKGEVTFSSRFFPEDEVVVQLGTSVEEFTVYNLKRSVPSPNSTSNVTST